MGPFLLLVLPFASVGTEGILLLRAVRYRRGVGRGCVRLDLLLGRQIGFGRPLLGIWCSELGGTAGRGLWRGRFRRARHRSWLRRLRGRSLLRVGRRLGCLGVG